MAETITAELTIVRHLRNPASAMGNSSSSVSISFEKTLRSSPRGLVSKKLLGARSTRASTSAWMRDAAEMTRVNESA
eukprot:jgi/Chrpa1/27862/Chrysochromulina_OHIO_Genome00002092-RA